MLVKTVKNDLREKLRTIPAHEESMFADLLATYFNCLLGSPPDDSEVFWKDTIKKKLRSKFLDALTEAEAKDSVNLKDHIGKSFFLFAHLLQQEMRLNLDSVALNGAIGSQRKLSPKDFLAMDIKIKQMAFVLLDEATSLMRVAMREHGSQDAEQLLSKGTLFIAPFYLFHWLSYLQHLLSSKLASKWNQVKVHFTFSIH